MSSLSLRRSHAAAEPTLKSISKERLRRMADAGVTVVECMRLLHERGSNLVIEALRGSSEFVEWQHYPANEVYDPSSHAQYYYHAHPAEDRAEPDYGHFHTFLRPDGMPAGIRPATTEWSEPQHKQATGSPTHLIAIAMTPAGMPVRLFTTNRWVTAETWHTAPDVIAMLDRFTIDLDVPSAELNQWLTAMFVLFRPQIERLLIERDAAIAQWHARHAGTDVLEDRQLDVASSLDISLYDHIAWLDRELDRS
jgi:hypothetical protein